MVVERTRTILGTLSDRRVAVVGDHCVDAYWHLQPGTDGCSVETGLPVQEVITQEYGLGGAGNVIANLRALGVGQVRALGVRGADPFGAVLQDLMAQLDVDTSGLLEVGTGWQTCVYVKPCTDSVEGSRFDLGAHQQLPDEVIAQLDARLSAAAEWADVVVVNQQVAGILDVAGVVDGVNEAIARHPETTFIVDARDAATRFRGAVLKANIREALALAPEGDTATDGSDVDVPALARTLSLRAGHPVVITRGERGIVAADGAQVHEALGVEITSPVEPVGAGDTVLATVAAVLAGGGDLELAAILANLAASVTVRKLGTTGTVNADELLASASAPDHIYAPELAANPARARQLPGTEIELVEPVSPPMPLQHVIFDHDGTLSTLRQGWELVMEPVMLRAIAGPRITTLDTATYTRIRDEVLAFIDRTTGIQTLVQMQGLVELVRRFGFVPEDEILDEHGYKAIYNDELIAMVRTRMDKLEAGHLAPEDLHVKNALPLLQALQDRGATLHLASGTDRDDVVAEARALGFEPFFGDRIDGAVGDVTVEAKRQVMDRIVREHGIDGSALVTFGDGPVEMRETRKRGGFAIGVCSDETRRYGFNPEKRERLIRGGACVLVPDFSDLDAVLGLLGIELRRETPQRSTVSTAGGPR